MSKPVRHACCPVRAVVGVCRYPAFRIRFRLYAVHGIIGIGNYISLRVRFRQPVAVCIVGIRKGIAQRILAGKHAVHFIIDKGARLPFPVGDGSYVARCIVGIISGVSCRVRLCHAPAFCIIGIGRSIPQRVRFRQAAVHGVVGIAPDIALRVRHGCHTRPVIGESRPITFSVRHGNQSVFPVITIGSHAALRVRHGNQPVLFVIGINRHAAVIIRNALQKPCRRIGIAPLRPVLPRLCQHAPCFVIGVSCGDALSVRRGGQISLPIVGAAFRAAVRILYFYGAETAVIIIDGFVPVCVHGLGSAVSIGERHNAPFRVRLSNHTPFFIIGICHHAVSVFVIPCRHPVRPVVGKAQHIACFVRHGHKIARAVIPVADAVSVRQPDGCNTVFPVKRHRVQFSRRGGNGGKSAVHAIRKRRPSSAGILDCRKLPVIIKQMFFKAGQIRNGKAAVFFRQGIRLSCRRTVAVPFFFKSHDAARPRKPEHGAVRKLSKPLVKRRAPAEAEASRVACAHGIVLP